MALDMTTALTIKANVDGLSQIQGLERALGAADKQANGLSGSFGKLSAMAKNASTALTAIGAAAVGGLAVLGKKAIDAADNLNDLSQRTGVGVETLSKFGAAAEDSGSSIDEVAKAMGKLSKGIVDPASKANEALKSIGVSSVDASGKVRSVDAVMLDIADKFSKLPDGAQKTALAMELFGKSGMNLIPMLNGGRDALSQYSATIDTEMAQAADKFNDALNAIARSVAGPFNEAITALLPFITKFAETIANLAVNFSKLPEPLQAIIFAFGAIGTAAIILAPILTPIISGFKFLAGLQIGTILSGWGPVFGQVGQALLALGRIILGLFTGPFGWVALLVGAGIAIYAFRDQIGQAFQAIGNYLTEAAKGFKMVFIDPVANAMKGLVDGIKSLFSGLAAALKAPFEAVANMIRGIVNGIIGGVERGINGAIEALNRMIRGANAALAKVGLPQIPTIPAVQLPRFAEGGVVTGPTVAMVGEGGEPEYIVPQSKAAGFAANWMAGKRGAGAIPRFAEGGVVMPSTANVNIQTGPVTQMNGTNFVTTQDMSAAVRAGVQQTLDLIRRDGNVRTQLGLA